MRYILPACIIAFSFSLLGELGSFWWIFDLLSHWRILYLLAGVVLLVVTSLVCRRSLTLAVMSIMAVHLLHVIPYVLPTGPSAVAAETHQETLRIAFANTYWHNHNIDQIERATRAMDADVIIFFELMPDDYQELQKRLAVEYPYGRMQAGEYAFNVGYLGKNKPSKDETIYFTKVVPTLELRYILAGTEVVIIGAHPYSPVVQEFAKKRDAELAALAQYIAQLDVPVVAGGDFNVSQFSAVFTQLLADSGTRDTQRQFGLQNSWPTHHPAVARIPIDQVLVSDQVKVFNRYIGEQTGSDHLPVVVEVGL